MSIYAKIHAYKLQDLKEFIKVLIIGLFNSTNHLTTGQNSIGKKTMYSKKLGSAEDK